jgi:hypothetical protein
MLPTPVFRIIWAALGGVALVWVVTALVIEFMALHDPESGDTLSETVWSMHLPHVIWFVVAGFLAWIVIHFLSGGKWGI